MILLTSFTMQSPSTKFFFLGLIALISTSVRAEKTCTLVDFGFEISDNSYISSASHEVNDGKISSTLEIAKCFEPPVTLECNVFSNGDLVNSNANKYKWPINDLKDGSFCEVYDPEPEKNEDCAMNEGKQLVDICDPCSALTGMPEGDGEAQCTLSAEGKEVAKFNIVYKNEDK